MLFLGVIYLAGFIITAIYCVHTLKSEQVGKWADGDYYLTLLGSVVACCIFPLFWIIELSTYLADKLRKFLS